MRKLLLLFILCSIMICGCINNSTAKVETKESNWKVVNEGL